MLELRKLRINDLWVGLESGSDEVLQHLNKGHSITDAYEQLERLNKAGIRHNDIFMIGAGGKGSAMKSAENAAKLINTTKSNLVGITSLGFFEGSALTKEMQVGDFTPASELEILEEERKLIELIELEDMPFYGDHPINSTRLMGLLPKDKVRLLQAIDDSIKNSSPSFLQGSATRLTL